MFLDAIKPQYYCQNYHINTTTKSIQNYLVGIEYNSASDNNHRVEAIYHGEGRFFNTNTSTTTPTYRTEYTIKDHFDD